ncbi:MAG: hypothetical protein LUQ16_03665 [Methanomassiliicoccales archaeon]|nr:hypothetical protein [Methanomassiliicoccales archaeon]MDD1756243.1 hypothetical protein [Methanomassiliicoccales archaeon]
MPKPFHVEHALEIAILVTVVGAALSVVSLMDLAAHIVDLGDWVYWIIVIGVIVFIIGIYLLASYLKLTAQFDRFMKVTSRAEFKRDLDEVEYLAWRLPSRYAKRLGKKKEEIGVK